MEAKASIYVAHVLTVYRLVRPSSVTSRAEGPVCPSLWKGENKRKEKEEEKRRRGRREEEEEEKGKGRG